MKITAIKINTGAVGAYRVSHPLQALADLGHQTHVIAAREEGDRVSNLELEGDILIIQRQANPRVFDLVDSLPEERRPKVVYELDDNPWDLHSWDELHRSLGPSYGRKVTKMIERCAAVTCTTPALAARVREAVPGVPVWVIPNAIDYQIREWEGWLDRADFGLEEKVVIGWSGSVHHSRDAEAMLPALAQVLDEHPDCVFALQGDPRVFKQWAKLLPKGRVVLVDVMDFKFHPCAYTLFDINLAPLANTAFNRCKSDLKLIEGGAQGVPYVAANVAPYADFHRQSAGIGGYLAASPDGWREGIERLLRGEREARGATLKRYVREKRALSVVVGQWQACFEAVCAAKEPEPIAAPNLSPGRNDECPCGTGYKYKRCCAPAYG